MAPSLLYLLPLAAYWLVLIYWLGAQWSVYEQYHYGWAVPFLCLYLLWRKAESRKQKVEKGLPGDGAAGLRGYGLQTAAGGLDYAGGNPGGGRSLIWWGLLVCALLYAPTRFLHEANPIWRLTSLLWTLIVISLTLLVLRSRGPEVSWSRGLVFPICFFLVAVPWPSGVENFLIQSLMRLNVATTIELLGLFGIPAVQHGNVIEIGAGMVGVDEACSGIRSFQATLMISLFLGELYRLAPVRRFGVVLLGFVLAFAFNVGRTLLLTGVAFVKGVAAVSSWHDPASITILVACFLSVWLLAWRLRGDTEHLKSEMLTAETGAARPMASIPVVRGPVVSLSLLAWLLVVEAGTEFWYRSHESSMAASVEWSVRPPAPSANYSEVKIPPEILGQFRSDEDKHVQWVDDHGNPWELYYFRWFPAHSLQKRVAIQMAKTHGPEKCLPAVGMSLKADLGIITVPIAGLEVVMQHYMFSAEGRLLHVFYGIYEDPTGSAKLANRRKDFGSRVAAALDGSRNYGQRFLELAVTGYDRPEAAKAALAQELGKLIRVEAPAPKH